MMLRNCANEIRRELCRSDEAAGAALEAWAMLSLSFLARAAAVAQAYEPPWLVKQRTSSDGVPGEPISLSSLAATRM